MPAPSALLRRCRLIENPPEFPLLQFSQRWRAGSLGLQQCSQENPVILPSAGTADGPLMHLIPDPLALKNVGFPFAAEVT